MKRPLAFVSALLAGSLVYTGIVCSQDGQPSEKFAVPTFNGKGVPVEPTAVVRSMKSPDDKFVPRDIGQFQQARDLANQLGAANEQNTPEANKRSVELTQKLETAIANMFDEDLADRERQLAKVEERVKNLRNLLDRRRKAKSEIVQLEAKVLINEASGLGFSRGGNFKAENVKGRWESEFVPVPDKESR